MLTYIDFSNLFDWFTDSFSENSWNTSNLEGSKELYLWIFNSNHLWKTFFVEISQIFNSSPFFLFESYLETQQPNNHKNFDESVTGSVIQATGTMELEDGLWIWNHLKARNGLQCDPHYTWGSTRGSVSTHLIPLGTKSAWVHMAAWYQARRRVWFPAATV